MTKVEKIKCGAITFIREDNGGRECWRAQEPKGTNLTHWAVKHYTDTPDKESGFSGWRVVSGGPFTSAGGWTNRKDALSNAAPWILRQWISQAKKKRALAIKQMENLERFLKQRTKA